MVDGASVTVPPQIIIGVSASITTLRAVDSDVQLDGQPIIVTGVLQIYLWDADSMAVDNGTSVVRPNDRTSMQAGRWLRYDGGISELLSGTGGAGLVGTTDGDTVQAHLNRLSGLLSALPQSQAWQRKMIADQSDCRILIISDSIGDGADRWAQQSLPELAEMFPEKQIQYALAGPTGVWGSYVVYPGTAGTNTLYVDIFAIQGTKPEFSEGAQQAVTFRYGAETDMVWITHGLNFGINVEQNIMYYELTKFIGTITDLCPNAGVISLVENPNVNPSGPGIDSGEEFSLRLAAAWQQVANEQGIGLIPVYDFFKESPFFGIPAGQVNSLYVDLVHPSPFGTQLYYIPPLMRAIAFNADLHASPQLPSFWRQVRQNFMPNPNYGVWTGAAPEGYTLTNCTASKDPGRVEQGLYALKLTITGANATITCDLSSQLDLLRGKRLTYISRPYKPSGFTSTEDLPTRLAIVSTNGVDTSSGQSYNYLEGNNGYRYVITQIDVLDDASSLVTTEYVGPSTTVDNGKSIWLNYNAVFIGSPGALDFAALPTGGISEFYSPSSVGPVALLNSGTVTAVGDEITVAGASGPEAQIFINVPPTTPGTSYRLSFLVDSLTTSGAAGGSVSFYLGLDGYGTAFGSAPDWVVGTPYSVDFVAPTSGPITIRINPFPAATAWHVDTIAIAEISVPEPVSLLWAHNSDGTVVDATGGAAKFKIVSVPGTSLYLSGDNAQSATITSSGLFSVDLPSAYVNGSDVTIAVNANYSGTGTAGTRTVQVKGYKISTAGVSTAITPIAAKAITTTAASCEFAITGTTLINGDRLAFEVVTVMQEISGTNPLAARINSIGYF